MHVSYLQRDKSHVDLRQLILRQGLPVNISSVFPVLSALSFVAAFLFILPRNVQAEFYKYKDSSGALVITNKLEDVPKKYRKNVKVVWDDELTAKDPLARRSAAAESQRELQQRQHAQQLEKQQGGAGKLRPSDGKTLVITFDEETGQLIRTME
jgi:hypothetical protein